MVDFHKNFAASTVATAPSPASSGLSLIVATGEGTKFPSPYFNAVVWPANVQPTTANSETVRVTAIAGDTFTIVRQQEGSSARTITVGDQIADAATTKVFTDLELLAGLSLQQGVLGAAGDAALSVNSTSQVTIAPATNFMVARTDGLLVPVTSVSTVLSGITAAATYTRLDEVVIDSNGVVSRLAGAESNGVTLANRTGAQAVPSGSRLLHDILVTTGGVTAANCRDRRPWARGAYSRIVRSAGDYTVTSSSLVAIDSTNLAARIETLTGLLRVTLRGVVSISVGTHDLRLAPYVDGAAVDGLGGAAFYTLVTGDWVGMTFSWDLSVAAGSHLIVPYWSVPSATGTISMYANANNPTQMTIEELVRLNASNGAT